MNEVKTWAKRVALAVFLADIVHVYSYINEYYEDDDAEGVYDDERVYEDERIIQAYAGDCAPDTLVSKQELDKAVEDLLNDLETHNPGKSGLMSIDHPSMIVNRESIAFAGGGRATFLQLAHPFIAAGIRQHSALENGVSRRFYNTFKYMFGMIYGTREEIAKSARAVQQLHAKVNGTMNEDVGIFSSSSKFSASEKNAIRFVAATLLETAVFEYEMHVRLLSDAEKDVMVRDGAKLIQLFGVRPTANDPKTWKEFRRHMGAVYRSKLLTVSETAKDTVEFLLLPPTAASGPLLNLIRWSTIVSLPPRIAKQYAGRTPSWIDRVLFAFFHAIIRFQYRLTPGSWRYLTAYWRMYDRENPGKRGYFSKLIGVAAARFSNFFLAMAMPSRDPEEARKKVKESRAKQIGFQRVPGSPIKVST